MLEKCPIEIKNKRDSGLFYVQSATYELIFIQGDHQQLDMGTNLVNTKKRSH